MTKDDVAACQELHAGDGDDGLKDMDVAMNSPFPRTFDEEDVKLEVEAAAAAAAVMTSSNVGVDHDRELYKLLDDVNDVSDTAMFYNDFPPLPDFPCISSSSSSSSAPVPSKHVASTSSSSSASSSSATSWAVFRPETEDYYNISEGARHHRHNNDHVQRQQRYGDQGAVAAALSSTASMEINLPISDDSNPNQGDAHCINVMENFEYMDLLDGSDIWDPSSIFESEIPQQQDDDVLFPDEQEQSPQAVQQDQNHRQQSQRQQEEGNDGLYFLQGNSELALIFFDWLKQNKDYISAQEMRSIKLKRATIDCALKRLGSTREGKKQLLKLILEWVEQYQLQKKRAREIGAAATDSPYDPYPPPPPPPDLTINTSPDTDLNCNPVASDPNTCFSPPSAWPPPPTPAPRVPESSAMMATAYPHTMGVPGGGYMCDIPYSGAPDPSVNGNLYVPTSTDQYQPPPMDSMQSWNIAPPPFAAGPYCHYRPFPDATTTKTSVSHSHAQAVYGSPYPYPIFDSNTGERLVRLGSSATKEARKKRMARQRRISSNQCRHHQQHNQHQNLPQDLLMAEQQVHVAVAPGVAEDCNPSVANPTDNWIYWPPPPPATNSLALVSTAVESSGHAQTQTPAERGTMQQQNQQQRSQPPADRKQGPKTEKNLKFLLQKVLKQSDVGNLGRIVLPKKEAEIHLPELESRDGISIAMEDIGTSKVWNMRYRFWPNNKSRMYLLENTGDFVRLNGLQEGDFIVIYSDTKCGKYLIRGVKVRQPGSKPEAKKPSKKNQRNAMQPSSKQTAK